MVLRSKFHWVVEYWDDKAKAVFGFTSKDGHWVQAPEVGVIYVHVKQYGIRPMGSPDRLYTMTLSGLDNYFLVYKGDALLFGGWNDDGKSGRMYRWSCDKRWIETTKIISRPDCIKLNAEVKLGVWVDEPWATALGLNDGEVDPSIKLKRCCD